MAETTDTRSKRRISAPILIAICTVVFLIIVSGLAWILWPRIGFGYQNGEELTEEMMGENPFMLPTEVDLPAPDLTLLDLEGNSVSLSEYNGKVVLVNIWAFWCTSCRIELVNLQKYYQKHRKQNFEIVGIEVGNEVEDIAYHVNRFKLTFPIWQDTGKIAPDAFKMVYLPSSYVIDESGRIRLTWAGAINCEMLEKYVTPLLE